MFDWLKSHLTLFISGYPAHPWHHPPVPERPGSTWPDVPTAAVFRNPPGPGPAQQVWVSGALQTRPSAGPQTTAGEMAEGGQGMWRMFISTHRGRGSCVCVCVVQGTGCALVVILVHKQSVAPYFLCWRKGLLKQAANDCLCVSYLRCLL